MCWPMIWVFSFSSAIFQSNVQLKSPLWMFGKQYSFSNSLARFWADSICSLAEDHIERQNSFALPWECIDYVYFFIRKVFVKQSKSIQSAIVLFIRRRAHNIFCLEWMELTSVEFHAWLVHQATISKHLWFICAWLGFEEHSNRMLNTFYDHVVPTPSWNQVQAEKYFGNNFF